MQQSMHDRFEGTSERTSDPDMSSDKIVIEDLHVRGIIGVDDWEREHRQDLRITIEMRADLDDPIETDRVEDTVNYRSVSKTIQRHVQEAERRTVEALAGDVAGICLSEENVSSVTVRVEKPDALREAGTVAVEMTRC